MITGLHQIALPVADLDRAEAFYGDIVGLTLIARFDPPGLVFFDLGGPRLLLDGTSTGVAGCGGVVYLRTNSLDRHHERLTGLAVEILGPPQMVHRDDTGTFGPPGGEEWMLFLRDPDGHTVTLVERR